jgi:hypothetical protein
VLEEEPEEPEAGDRRRSILEAVEVGRSRREGRSVYGSACERNMQLVDFECRLQKSSRWILKNRRKQIPRELKDSHREQTEPFRWRTIQITKPNLPFSSLFLSENPLLFFATQL